MSRFLAGLALLLTLSACSSASTDGLMPTTAPESFDCNVPFTPVLRAFNGGQVPQLAVITTQEDWCALWDAIYSLTPSPPPCETGFFDFQWQAALVAATVGPNACVGIEITCVHRDADDNLTVVYRVSPSDPPGQVCALAIVNPVDVVRIELPVGLVTFVPETSP